MRRSSIYEKKLYRDRYQLRDRRRPTLEVERRAVLIAAGKLDDRLLNLL